MGCGSSKAVATVVPSTGDFPTTRNSIVSEKQRNSVPNKNADNNILTDRNNNVNSASPSNSLTNVTDDSSTKPREISASSTRTADSGISELEEGEIFTENSNPDRIMEIDALDRPSTPELSLEGRACPRLQSGKEKRRLEKKNFESSIPNLPPLGDGSLLERPKTRGVTFNVMLCPETGNIKKAPANLQKLERRKRGKKLTKEELDEKMRRAAERRKEHKRKIVEKSQAFIAAHGNLNHTRTKTEKDQDTSKKQYETSWEDQGIGEEKDQEFDYGDQNCE